MNLNFLFISPSGGELVMVLVVVLMLFGSKKLPELARGLGKGIREFKDATGEIQKEIKSGMTEVTEVKKSVEDKVKNTFKQD